MSAPAPSFDPALYIREPAWWRTVAWPQVVTLVGIGLAVLAPIVAGLLLAA